MPPFEGVAVKLTEVPGQNGLLVAEMLTPASKLVFSSMVIVVLDAGLFDVHCSDDVRMQSTWSLLTGL